MFAKTIHFTSSSLILLHLSFSIAHARTYTQTCNTILTYYILFTNPFILFNPHRTPLYMGRIFTFIAHDSPMIVNQIHVLIFTVTKLGLLEAFHQTPTVQVNFHPSLVKAASKNIISITLCHDAT